MDANHRSFEEHDGAKRFPPIPPELAALRETYERTTPWRGNVAVKIQRAAPYYFFLTRIQDCPDTYDEDLTLSFPELLDSSLGEIEHSLHINFMVDLGWLLAQYAIVGIVNPWLTIIHDPDSPDFGISPHMRIEKVCIRCPSSYGKHHTKLSLFYYKDRSIRILLSSANLLESDWCNRTQGLWLSPKCPYMGESVPVNCGESRTLFKYDLITYLKFYRIKELEIWVERLGKVDMSMIKFEKIDGRYHFLFSVFFVASVPCEDKNGIFALNKMRRILSHVKPDGCTWPVVAQASSIGSLGPSPNSWFTTIFASRLQGKSEDEPCNIKVVFPSFKTIQNSYDGLLGGLCVPYRSLSHSKQLWLNRFMHHWKSPYRYRTRAVPHIKTYTQLSPDGDRISWFLITSANLSKAAWGAIQSNNALRPMSYEAGVLFLPEYTIQKTFFTIRKAGTVDDDDESFPFPYDSELCRYEDGDHVFLYDIAFGPGM